MIKHTKLGFMRPSRGGEWDSKPHEEVSITSGRAITRLAQSGSEQNPYKIKAGGSNPSTGTIQR